MYDQSNTKKNTNTKMNSYYSLTDIKYYNISESEVEQQQQQQQQPLQQHQQQQEQSQQVLNEPLNRLNNHQDVGYSSDNEQKQEHQKTSTQTLYKNNQRKSYSDYGFDKKQHLFNGYKLKRQNKSRNRRVKEKSDDDYDDDSYDDYNYQTKLKNKKINKNCTLLHSTSGCNKSWKQSSTTSAYDTSSNLSNEGYFNTISEQNQALLIKNSK
jgi:hypothetical protein